MTRDWDIRQKRLVRSSLRYGDYVLHWYPLGDESEITATLGDEVVGRLFYGLERPGDATMKGAVEVHPAHRRRGLASAMYDWAESMSGMSFVPEEKHTSDAEAFWQSRARRNPGVSVFENPREPHSVKALKTLELMGTAPDDWHLTPIKWVKEMREVHGEVTCSVCDGNTWVMFAPDGSVVPPPDSTKDYRAWDNYMREARMQSGQARYGNCPRCKKSKRGWGEISTGKVLGLVMREVMVGYPDWPEGVDMYASRFSTRDHGLFESVCGLCSKTIKRSWRVPVNTDGADPLGMWVGEDCAKKFLGVKLKRKDDSLMEDGNLANGPKKNPSRNPAADPSDLKRAISKYEEFHDLPHEKVGKLTSGSIPKEIGYAGDAKWVLYQSKKWTGKATNYIHDHEAGVACGRTDLKTGDYLTVPKWLQNVDTLVHLGHCLEFGYIDDEGNEVEMHTKRPYPQLYCTPNGKALVVVENHKIVAMMWGAKLNVEDRGIVN